MRGDGRAPSLAAEVGHLDGVALGALEHLVPERLHRGGFHGNLAPFGSITAERPSVVISRSAVDDHEGGIPRTLYFFESFALRLRSEYGSASHGCSA